MRPKKERNTKKEGRRIQEGKRGGNLKNEQVVPQAELKGSTKRKESEVSPKRVKGKYSPHSKKEPSFHFQGTRRKCEGDLEK